MNVLSVTGRLTSDPARRDTTNGVVCEFRVAVDGQRRLWLPVVTWGKLAGTCKRHLHTGRRVAISGQLCVDVFHAAQGDLRRRWFLRAEHVTFLDPPRLQPNLGEATPNESGFEPEPVEEAAQ